MEHIKIFIKKYAFLILSAFLGAAAFLCIYGPEPLRVTAIGWTEAGYNNHDITQHQAGWMFFRNSPWTFPLCKALYLGYPEGTSVTFTDSIPLAALFFKMISPLLPDNFQYFGIYALFCFMMQGLFASALLHRFTRDRLFSLAGSLLFVISSPFLERCFRHTAMSSYWLLLAALYLCFAGAQLSLIKYYVLWTVLLCLTLGIHPYLFAMVSGVFVFSGIQVIRSGKTWKKTLMLTAAGIFTALIFGFILGIFGNNISPAEDYGRFSLNLNALWNPKSKYHTLWSAFLPALPLYDVQGDGIYYLGPGLLAAAAVFGLLLLFRDPGSLKPLLKHHGPVLLLMVLYTLFALSSILTINDRVLLRIPLPSVIFRAASIFRASERFFLLPYYCIILGILCLMFRFLQRKTLPSVLLCLIILTIQTIDILPGLKDLHLHFSDREMVHEYTEDWQQLAERYRTAVTFEQLDDKVLAFWLARKGFKTNMNISAENQSIAYWNQTQEERNLMKAALETGNYALDPDTIVIIPEIVRYHPWSFHSAEELSVYLDKVRSAYDGKAELRYLSMDLNDAVQNYWILCPNQ